MATLKARMIFEIMGRPPERITEALQSHVTNMGSEKGITILDKKYHEPKPVPDSDNLFTTFAETEIEFKTIPDFFASVMLYFPANIEVFEPENFKLSSADMNDLVNFLASRMHHYDAVTKNVLREREMLINTLKEKGILVDNPDVKKPEAEVSQKKTKQTKKSSKKKKSTRSSKSS